MIDNPQMGYPDGPMPEDQHAQQLDSRIGQDHPLPPAEAYETLTMPIPAAPLDLSTVAQDVANQVDWMNDPVAYATEFTNRIVQANQYSPIPENIDQGPIPSD